MDKRTTPTPLPMSAQTIEDRGFERVYKRNPLWQARYVAHLLGFRGLMARELGEDDQHVKAIDETIVAFRDRFPEFMFPEFTGDNDLTEGTYRADPVVVGITDRIIRNHERGSGNRE